MLQHDMARSFHRNISHCFLRIMLSISAMGRVRSRVVSSLGIARVDLFTIAAVKRRRLHMLWWRMKRMAMVQ